MGVGSQIARFAIDRGMSIRQLANLAGIPYNTLYSIIKRDSNRIDGEYLSKIAIALGCNIRDLVPPARETSTGVLMADMKHRQQMEELMDEGYTFSEREHDLIYACSQMNNDGQWALVHLAQDLAQVPKYKKPSGGGSRAVDPQEND